MLSFKHRIDCQSGDFEFFFETFLHDSEGVDKKYAVLAARHADENMLTIFNHIKFDDCTHELAEIGLWNVDIQ